jgi:predicted PurR-regulated permease PerM
MPDRPADQTPPVAHVPSGDAAGDAAGAPTRQPLSRRDGGRTDWVPRLLLGAAGLYVAFWLLGRLRDLLVLLLVAVFVALAVEPAANALARRGWRRGLATALVFALFLIGVVVFVTAIGGLLAGQVGALGKAVPKYAQQIVGFLNDVFHTNLSGGDLADKFRHSQGVRDFVSGVAATAVGLSTSLVGLIFQGFTVLLFAFYLVADGPRFRRAVCSLVRPDRQQHVLRAWTIAVDATGGYLASRALLAACSAAVTWLFLALIGVPYPLALALWTGLVSQFIPTVGTYLAGALPVLVALLHDPLDAVWTLAFILAYQQVENYLLAPRVTAQTMELHPAVAFGAVIAGGAILGPVGALLALPAAASLQAFTSIYLRRYDVPDRPPGRPGPGAS